MLRKRIGKILIAAWLMAFIFSINPIEVLAAEIVSVTFPTANKEGDSPFDFIIDPQALLYETGASAYGGGKVEEGAFLLFRNHEGDYDFSRISDYLMVRNNSEQPAVVTVNAVLDGLDEVDIVDYKDFDDSDSCSLYLALVDDDGNEMPIPAEDAASISFELDAYSECSFGLTGACNEKADWGNLSLNPSVNVIWSVETLTNTDEEIGEISNNDAEQIDDTASDSLSINSMPDESIQDADTISDNSIDDATPSSDNVSLSENDALISDDADWENGV